MSQLSEVSQLFAQRAGDLEKSREIFTAETRGFVSSILAAAHRTRAEPWVSGRVRVDLPKEIDNELKAGYLTSQFALARVELRFKKGTNFTRVAEVNFGVEFDQESEGFTWTVKLVPEARYQRLDDLLWRQMRVSGLDLPKGHHFERANTVRFVLRALDADLNADAAFNDIKAVLEFLVSADQAIADAVGLDAGPRDEAPVQ
jgi:hypothetical protein